METRTSIAKKEEVLLHCFLFAGFTSPQLHQVLEHRGESVVFPAGSLIFGPNQFRKAVGILLQGQAQAETCAEDKTVVLNRFTPSMLFGAAAVFRQAQHYVSEIRAKTRCTVLFLTDTELEAIFQEDFRAAKNYLSFLSQRIAFLNRKIDGFTRSSAEEKLALYLHGQCVKKTNGALLPWAPTKLSQELGVSRVTAYRALERFCALGYLEKEGHQLRILDIQALLDYRDPGEEK